MARVKRPFQVDTLLVKGAIPKGEDLYAVIISGSIY